jgi:hypothetical protein
MKNLYLVTLNSDTRILIVASEENAAGDYCLPVMRFGEWVESIEFIAVVGGNFEEGEILKRF